MGSVFSEGDGVDKRIIIFGQVGRNSEWNYNFFMKKVFSFIKKIIYKIFGKLRWFLLGFVLCLLIATVPLTNTSVAFKITAIKDENGKVIHETAIRDVENFSVNNKGEAVIVSDFSEFGFEATFDTKSGETIQTGSYYISADVIKDDSFWPSDIVITDDGDIYVVRAYYDDFWNNRVITKESIVQLSGDYEYVKEICEIPYDENEKKRVSRLSKLHFYDGELTFADIQEDGVVLYSVDTASGNIRTSKKYPTESNGTMTVNVIPLDGEFLFIKTDGCVYRTGFDEELKDCIFHLDSATLSCFTQAVKCGDGYYLFDENNSKIIYYLNDNVVSRAIDFSSADSGDSEIKFIDSYRNDDGEEVLLICLSDGLYSYAGGTLTDLSINLKVSVPALYYVRLIFEKIGNICQWCIIINLIIRRKTLFYKLMLATVPVLSILAVVIAAKIYSFTLDENIGNIHDELSIISLLGQKEFDGYDFSPLMVQNEDTGTEYRNLTDKISDITTGHTASWSEDYEFAIIYCPEKEDAYILVSEDKIRMPLTMKETTEFDRNADISISETINAFTSSEAGESRIAAFARLNDKEDCGKYYLKISTANRRFWYTRRQLILGLAGYTALVIVLITAIILLASLYIKGAVLKARKVVNRISEGDLSARTKYKSKDELGEMLSEVNVMGENLERLFDEKDRTEKFYYKFVPEQFRTLLGKENFTDLALGDSDLRELTVLFMDIRAFSKISEQMTTKENFEFVNIIYGICGPIIRQNNGFIDKYIGDAIMALFENADDAVKSGIEIYRAVVLNPDTSVRLGVEQINIGIGIHTGPAQIGIVGEEERLSGTVISDTVNLSSRFEGLTKQYKTAMLLSKDTTRKLSDPESLNLRYLGNVQVAGVNEVKEIYEVLDCLPDEERMKRDANSDMLEEAIRLFGEGYREEALETLREISSSGKGDYVTDKYLDYITNLSPDEKEGVLRFVRK